MKKLPRDFYLQDTVTVARELLGCVLWRRAGGDLLAARLVETDVVCQEADVAEAVLLRAAEPAQGIEAMRARRPHAKRDLDLMNGPGKLCAAMDIDRALDGVPLDGKELWIAPRDASVAEEDIAVSPRVGVEGSGEAAHWPLRFYLRGSRHVSPHRHV